MKTIQEKLETAVQDSADVLVIGGGIAGVAAALAARRQGSDVLLIEKSALFGGLATNGLISWYEPLCDGHGNQLIRGLAEELLWLSFRYGPDSLPSAWKNPGGPADKKKMLPIKHQPEYGRYATYFSPTLFQLALDEVLQREGVRIHLCMAAVRPLMGEGNRCAGIAAESVSGRQAFLGKVIVDATGSASVLAGAGVPCVDGSNYFSFVAQEMGIEAAQNILSRRKWHSLGSDLFGNGHPEGFPHYAGTTNEEETAFLLEGRKRLLEEIRNRDRTRSDVTALPSQAQFRKIRRLSGGVTLREEDSRRHHPRSVTLLSDFDRPGDWYEVPYECLYHPDFPNLLAAGRMISADGWAWDAVRVIPACAATGEAAGIAAAMAAEKEIPLSQVKIAELQERIRQRGGLVFRTETD